MVKTPAGYRSTVNNIHNQWHLFCLSLRRDSWVSLPFPSDKEEKGEAGEKAIHYRSCCLTLASNVILSGPTCVWVCDGAVDLPRWILLDCGAVGFSFVIHTFTLTRVTLLFFFCILWWHKGNSSDETAPGNLWGFLIFISCCSIFFIFVHFLTKYIYNVYVLCKYLYKMVPMSYFHCFNFQCTESQFCGHGASLHGAFTAGWDDLEPHVYNSLSLEL